MRGSPGASALLALAMLGVPQGAFADEGASNHIQSAAEEFDTGRRAYLAGDFSEAAVHFENAYRDAPRPEPLRSAIRARRAAHDDARAATLASLAAVRYGTDPATLALANEVLADLSARLLGISLACDPACGVAVDGHAVSLEAGTNVVLYVLPGKHALVVSWPDDLQRELTVDGAAGSVRDLSVTAPSALPIPAAVSSDRALAPPLAAPPPVHRKPLGPAVFAVGAGLTAAGIAATIVSGIAATNDPGVAAVRRDCVGQGTSCPTYQRGLAGELRTNVLLGATIGVGVITTVVGVFFTQWTRTRAESSRPSGMAARIGPYVPDVTVAPGAFTLGFRVPL